MLKIMAQLTAMEPGSVPLEKARMWGRAQGGGNPRYPGKFRSLDQAPNLDHSCITTWVQSKILTSHGHIVWRVF